MRASALIIIYINFSYWKMSLVQCIESVKKYTERFVGACAVDPFVPVKIAQFPFETVESTVRDCSSINMR